MEVGLIIVLFLVVAVMRVVQNVCNKLVSNQVATNKSFFAYGTYYQYLACILALITVLFTGFHHFNLGLVICAFVCAVLFAVDLFCGIEAIKGCSLAVVSMFSLGGLVISVIVSYFWFKEDINTYQLLGLGVFFVSAYLLSSNDKNESKKMTAKTLIMLLLDFLANGLILVAQKYFSLKVKGGNSPLFSFVTFFFCGTIMLISLTVVRVNEKRNGTQNSQPLVLSKKLLVCGLCLAVALFAINLIMTEMGKKVPSIIMYPTSSSISILIATLVGYIIFNERFTPKKIVGLILGISSIIIISVLK